ncbi:hypothetical protein CEXT_183091 [Caerostris extrusa]|uniref:Uncharacterized protein n=1 Tax=Caerostris extrusa TaxID=172846 RepID=A0AAV4VVG0_CAEEX|nr:hypothetical protein CEXT_183091 [Caerostris extrusa]
MTYKFNRLVSKPCRNIRVFPPQSPFNISLWRNLFFASMWKILKQGHKHSILCKTNVRTIIRMNLYYHNCTVWSSGLLNIGINMDAMEMVDFSRDIKVAVCKETCRFD